MNDEIKLSVEDFAVLAQCAIRYCHGRRTYMPGLVQGIVREHLQELSDKALYVMLNDCREMSDFDYGDPLIDKPGWIKFKEDLENERNQRQNQTGD